MTDTDQFRPLSTTTTRVADDAVTRYFETVISTLADLVAFRTVASPDRANAHNPEFLRLKSYLRRLALTLGLDMEDHGAAVLLGVGNSPQRIGLLTHADVRPADEQRWATDPFTLDLHSEPGRLLGRGVEDDKGPLAAAIYTMKALRDHSLPATHRVELIISLTEESDWTPFREFLAGWTPPHTNIALDAFYPVVTAERGTGAIYVSVPPESPPRCEGAYLASFRGGRFLAQIPAEAEASIVGPTSDLIAALHTHAAEERDVRFRFDASRDTLQIHAEGSATHSSEPSQGCNAITHLAALLGTQTWPKTQVSRMVQFINDLVGTGHHAERFGAVGYQDPFMGPLTLALTTLGTGNDGELTAGINIRRPMGRTREDVETSIHDALDAWARRQTIALDRTLDIGDPYHLKSAPHIPTLLQVFRHYTGQKTAEPITIGGGTQARLLPNGVNFGPAMPNEPYTGHSDHEFMTVERLRLSLRMYVAALADLTSG